MNPSDAAPIAATTARTTTLQVRKTALGDARLVTAPVTPLAAGEVRVRIDRFALTSNNITYAAFGDAMSYWHFFPAGEEGWGIVPAWGFGTVTESRRDDVQPNERLYGYWPMADAVVLAPTRVNAAGFRDGAPHRAELHAVYNQYLRCAADPFHEDGTEDVQALLRPLFVTSWLIDDFFADNGFFGAQTLLLSSASSKTAYGTAFCLKREKRDAEVVGLTSTGNKAFCESLGCYDRVLGYDEFDRIAPDAACAYIDFAGDAPLRRAVHTRFGNLKVSSSIGGTHLEHLGGAKDLPGPRATLFFAPAQIKKRGEEWGAAELNRRLIEAWQAFRAAVSASRPPWLDVRTHRGPEAVRAAYAQVLAGRGDPRSGHILWLWN